jgi:hypothetical protein
MSIKKFSKNKKELVFFGTNHSNKNNFQINQLKKELFEFKSEIILIEGGFEKSVFKNESEAISYGGELGFTSYYAKNNNILIEGNDPPEVESIEFLSAMYDRDFSFFYFVLRNFNCFIKRPTKESSEEIMDKIITGFKHESEWEDYDFSLDNFKNIFKNIFNYEFDFSKNYGSYFSSLENKKETNKATRKLNKFRDIYMIKKILEFILIYNKIFVVKGGIHLQECENLLEEIFK